MNFISNAFSLNMIESPAIGDGYAVTVTRLSMMDAREMLEEVHHKSVVGHADIANLVTEILNYNVQFNRESVKLRPGDSMVVAQYSGPRLPEGCSTLPQGAQIDFYLTEII
jgi:hypothetical protein